MSTQVPIPNHLSRNPLLASSSSSSRSPSRQSRLKRLLLWVIVAGWCLYFACAAVAALLNRQHHASITATDVPWLAVAMTTGLPVPQMPAFCPDKSTIQNTFKSTTYDTSLLLHRRKYLDADNLHKLSKWHVFSTSAWEVSVLQSAARLGVRNDSSIYEIGVGVGAWLLPLTRKHDGLELGGSDLASSAVGLANKLMGPHFCYADAHDLSYAPAGHYDFVASQAVFYIAAGTEEETGLLVKQAVRLLKPGTGRLFIGYNSDPACAKVGCTQNCGCGDGRINLRKAWWSENARTLGLKDIQILPSALRLPNSRTKYDVIAQRV